MKSLARTAALSFLDAIGTIVALKNQFSFRELAEYCRSEGILKIADNNITPEQYIEMSQEIHALSGGHVTITPQATPNVLLTARAPLSTIDLEVANVSMKLLADKWQTCSACGGSGRMHGPCTACNGSGSKRGKSCSECGGSGKLSGPCWTCSGMGQKRKVKKASAAVDPTAIKLDAQVTLHDGTELQVVAIRPSGFEGIDESLASREFCASDVAAVVNLSDPAAKGDITKCGLCGEKNVQGSTECTVCEAPLEILLAAK